MIEGNEEQVELEVFNFTGAGGVALAMYNTDEVLLIAPSGIPTTNNQQLSLLVSSKLG
jgi:isocitrate dehydrogenase